MNALPGPLHGLRIVSLALNLPGPAALMRCRQLGAGCSKLEPPSGDPMRHYCAAAYEEMHQGVEVATADLKSSHGQSLLHEKLAQSDVLLTSFRPSALARLGLDWDALHARHPRLNQVAIVGAPGAQAEEPGHDLTYQAAIGLVAGLDLPPTLYADMGGAMRAVEAVLLAALGRAGTQPGRFFEVALSEAIGFLALPHRWGITRAGDLLGGAHPAYRVYACADGRVALAALEPHFARRICELAGITEPDPQALAAFFRGKTCKELDRLAVEKDLPLHTMAIGSKRPSPHDGT